MVKKFVSAGILAFALALAGCSSSSTASVDEETKEEDTEEVVDNESDIDLDALSAPEYQTFSNMDEYTRNDEQLIIANYGCEIENTQKYPVYVSIAISGKDADGTEIISDTLYADVSPQSSFTTGSWAQSDIKDLTFDFDVQYQYYGKQIESADEVLKISDLSDEIKEDEDESVLEYSYTVENTSENDIVLEASFVLKKDDEIIGVINAQNDVYKLAAGKNSEVKGTEYLYGLPEFDEIEFSYNYVKD